MSTTLRRYACDDGALPRRVRQELTALLEEGAIVALPTETVYGLAARADLPSAVERLRRLKGRRNDHPLTWHVGDRAAVADAALPHTVARLAGRYWPGPLTLVVRGVDRKLAAVAEDGWVGVRLPAHTGTRELLAALPFPVVMTSANRTGEAPMCDPDAIAAAFGADLGYLVDDGPSRMGEASTVLRVGPGRFEVLREGLLALPELRRSAGLRIAFVCTGNTCRSPMAEGLAREALGRGLAVPPSKIGAFGFEVGSMGIFAADGAPAADHGVAVMARRGIDIASHRARTASEAIVADLDRVYGLTDSHVEALRTMLPARQRSRVELLDPEGRGVPDPIGGSVEDYAACADAIAASVARRTTEWL